MRAVCLQTERGLFHVAGAMEFLSWGLELVALPEQGPGFPALPGVPCSWTVCGLVPEGPVGRWPLKASVSVLLSHTMVEGGASVAEGCVLWTTMGLRPGSCAHSLHLAFLTLH